MKKENSVIDDIVEFNARFHNDGPAVVRKFPQKKLLILSCMDTRLVKLLPAALDIKDGDAKIIKNAGAVISHPFGSVMRSILVAIYKLGVENIMVVGHTDCGMEKLDTQDLMRLMKERGVNPADVGQAVDMEKWLGGFDNVDASVRSSADMIKNHQLIPRGIVVRGFVIDINTGRLREIK